jgi:CRP/FNR family transcriptional regulator
MSKNTFPAEAEVEEEIQTVLVPNELLREFVKEYDPWRKYFFDLLSSRLSEVMEIVEEVAFRKMDSRIADYIISNSTEGVLNATHLEIASELGTSREVVSRILKDLEKEKLIILDRGKIIINNHLQLNSKRS